MTQLKSTVVRIVLILLMGSSLGIALYAARIDKARTQPDTHAPTVQENTEPLALPTGAIIQVPPYWEVKKLPTTIDYQTHDITSPEGQFSVSEINTAQWLKGPAPDEGYVISHEYRPKALVVLQNIYDHQEITAADRMAFNETAGEFFGYSQNYRSALSYVASTDNSFRGISFYNLLGQDIGVSPIYYVVLYNPATGSIIFANYYLEAETPEVAAVNAKLRAIDWTKTNDNKKLEALDREARNGFKKLVEETARKNLSFGNALDTVDNFLKTATAKQ